MKIFKKTIKLVLCFTLSYALFSFVKWDFKPQSWSMGARWMFIVVSVIFYGFSCLEEEIDKKFND